MKFQLRKLLTSCLLLGILSGAATVPASANEMQSAIDLYEAGRFTQAREILNGIIASEPENDEARLFMGRTYYGIHDYDKAEEWFLEAVEIDGNNAENQFWLGAVYGRKAEAASIFSRIGLAKKTRNGFQKAIELNPEHVRAREALVRFYIKAPGIVGGGMDKAHAEAEEIKKRSSVWAHRAFAKIYEKEEKWDLAAQEHLAALKDDPNNADIYYEVNTFFIERGAYDQALKVLEQMRDTLADRPGALYQIGRLGDISGQNLDQAEKCLIDYLQSTPREDEPDFSRAHYRLGGIYEQKGNSSEAKKQFEECLKLDPDHKEAKKALKKL